MMTCLDGSIWLIVCRDHTHNNRSVVATKQRLDFFFFFFLSFLFLFPAVVVVNSRGFAQSFAESLTREGGSVAYVLGEPIGATQRSVDTSGGASVTLFDLRVHKAVRLARSLSLEVCVVWFNVFVGWRARRAAEGVAGLSTRIGFCRRFFFFFRPFCLARKKKFHRRLLTFC